MEQNVDSASSSSSSSGNLHETPALFESSTNSALRTSSVIDSMTLPLLNMDDDLSIGNSATPLLNMDNDSLRESFEIKALVAFMAPTAYQSQLLSLFLSSISTNQPTLAPTFRHHSNWLSEVAVRAGASSVLDWAIRAISLPHLGRQVQDQSLIQMSLQIYGKALLKLNAALQDPIKGFASDSLSATILLSFYELLNCTEKDS